MDFLVFSRGTPAAAVADDDPELDERHWTYMDGFAAGMTARGPALGPDRRTWVGSLHIVDLPDPQAAREFVTDEPYDRAGLFEHHLVRRFDNVLGRTMWQFADTRDEPRFLVLACSATAVPRDLHPVPLADLPQALRGRLVVYGELRDLDDDRPAGLALAVQAPTREALDALLAEAWTGLADDDGVEIHDWEFGGRR